MNITAVVNGKISVIKCTEVNFHGKKAYTTYAYWPIGEDGITDYSHQVFDYGIVDIENIISIKD